ncbi:MAG: kynureninase [Actinomycetota bacterium]|nr:kynureninase [Actinomycetota bacterium]
MGADFFAENSSLARDAADPSRRADFRIPPRAAADGGEWAYFAGNSLGLQPRGAAEAVGEELETWATLGVEAWFEGAEPWLTSADGLRGSLASLVGAGVGEVVAMNTLTVNLHLLMATFYRPSPERFRIVIEDAAFPSDSHAVASQASHHGYDPDTAVVRLRPRAGEAALRSEDIAGELERLRGSVALVLLGGISYLTGALVDIPAVTAAGHDIGAVVGWDLAHAAGNVPLDLHGWDVDWAAWCHYKYVNAGPGGPAGAFVHERHGSDASLPRLAGWWGNDPATRFRMEPGFVPRAGAVGWQVSTPPVIAFAPLRASLALFDAVGMPALRERSLRLTGYLESLLDVIVAERRVEILTPRDPALRGCQLSLAVSDARTLAGRLRAEHGVICDVREPDVIRLAPVPLYSSYHDCWRAATALREHLPER